MTKQYLINKLKQGVDDAKSEFRKYGYHSEIILNYDEMKALLDILQTEQLDKHVVSGKRPFQCPNCQATLQEVEMTNSDILDALAASAGGAVDTVAARGHVHKWHETSAKERICYMCGETEKTDAGKSSEGQP